MNTPFRKTSPFIISILIIGIQYLQAQPVNLLPEADIHTGISSNQIFVVKKDPMGILWCGTDQGVAIPGSAGKKYRSITAVIGNQPVWALEFIRGYIFIGTRYKGIYIFRASDGTLSQQFDSAQTGLCRRLRIIRDTVFLTNRSVPVYFTFEKNRWALHQIRRVAKNGFYTDVALFKEKIYFTKYGMSDKSLHAFRNDSLVSTQYILSGKLPKLDGSSLCLITTEQQLLAGGDGYYERIYADGRSASAELYAPRGREHFPAWDVCFIDSTPYLAIGVPDNMQEGMVFQPGVSSMENLRNNFYGLSLLADDKRKALWMGTANRGLFYWTTPGTSIELPLNQLNDAQYVSADQHTGYLFNTFAVWQLDWKNKKKKVLVRAESQNLRSRTILDVITWKDTIAVLAGVSVHLYAPNGKKIRSYDFNRQREMLSNRMLKIGNRLILFSSFYDLITEIDLRNEEIKTSKQVGTEITALPYQKGILYYSNNGGFQFYDSLTHSFEDSPNTLDNISVSGDTLWTLKGGILSAYRIRLHPYKLDYLFERSFQSLVSDFYPNWVKTASNRLYLGDARGYLEVDKGNGRPQFYRYLGNYSSGKIPVNDGIFLYFNYENYVTKIDPFEFGSAILPSAVKTNLTPSRGIYQRSPFSIHFLNDDFIAERNSLKELIIQKERERTDTLYTLLNEMSFPSGLEEGDYRMEVRLNGTKMDPISFRVKVEFTESVFFYPIIIGILLLIMFLVFRSILLKRTYEKKLMNSRLQLIKQNLNPHFIYNSLNLIYCQVLEKKTDAAAKTISQFSALHRYFLENINQSEITLEEELKFIESYLELEAKRVEMDKPFQYFLPDRTDKSLMELHVPAMILQPLVENAIKYSTAENGMRCVWVDIRQDGKKIILGVENTSGLDAVFLKQGHGLGLKIIAERIDIFNRSFRRQVQLRENAGLKYGKSGYRCEVVF